VRLVGGERLGLDLAFADPVEGVGDRRTQLLRIDVIDAVPDLLVAGETDANLAAGISGCFVRKAAVSMITATPDLLSAPSRVVPSVVMTVRPMHFFSSGYSDGRSTLDGSPGSTRSLPS